MIRQILETEDLWSKLKKTNKPILLYGMGDGAEKIITVLEKKEIEYKDIFASDGFVRGHSFRGKRVKSFSEIKEQYEDFIILLSFASITTSLDLDVRSYFLCHATTLAVPAERSASIASLISAFLYR